ncbi:MAG: precorrin-6y C5,15-methyltransferase (decarboxylating) subunit CbiE [Gammaproteobacteria bacterium]|nr:precorrin-6y C5,15-methyltransferase (decarboxylating) subunit CbiE [Gammaproteobacteria bacterium]
MSAVKPWLTIVGIGADGLAGLRACAREAIAAAEVLVGGSRHLAMLELAMLEDGGHEHLPRERIPWPNPFDAGIALLEARRHRRVCVLASGDPMWYGVGVKLTRHFDMAEIRVITAPGCISLACARMGWAVADTEVVSVHGRPLEALHPVLVPGARVLVIPHDGTTASAVAALLCSRGLGSSQVTVLEHLDAAQGAGNGERQMSARADAFAHQETAELAVLAIEVRGRVHAPFHTRVPGLADEAFEHDGQLTKRAVRAATLSALAPLPSQLLWDVGAGCGSVGIEWLRAVPRTRAVAVEMNAARVVLIHRNASALGVPHLQVRQGEAPAALAGLPAPDAVFIGGGASDDTVFEHCWAALPDGGRMVVNAVTLEGEAALIAKQARLGGELLRLSVQSARPTGRFRTFKAARPVIQLVVEKNR